MARPIRARGDQEGAAARENVSIPDDRAAEITNAWTPTSRAAKRIGKEVSGGDIEAPPAELRALFRAIRRQPIG
jgi:hypothetical protein